MLDANHCLQIDPSSMEAQPIRNGEEKPETRLEYERHAYHSLKEVLQLKLQQRRTREELVSQGIMPPLKSPAAFHEQRRSLERARTEDYLKRKIRSRPERSELVRMHILEETSAEPSLQAKQLQLKRARLADDLNDKISHRPGPIELIHKNILPVHALIGSESPKGESSSLDEDSSDALSPDQPANHDSPLGPASLHSPSDFLTLNGNPSPTQNLTNGTLTVAAFRPTTGQTRSKSNADRPVQRPKKPKDSKPKVKKLKYHQYIPPDQKAEREAPPQLDSSYAKILQQQQLFLQLQILNQQQQHYNYHTILPAPPKPPAEQPPPCSNPGPSPSRTVPTPMPALSNQNSTNRQSQMTVGGAKPTTLPANLDDFKVAELKHELKLRRCTVSGTKNDLIERLRNYQEHNGGTTAGAAGASPGSLKAFPPPKSQQTPPTQACSSAPVNHPSKDASGAKVTTFPFAAANGVHGTIPPTHIMRFSSTSSSPPVSPTPSERSLAGMSPDETSCSGDVFGEMVSSPLTQLTLHPSPEHPSPIKEERHGLARPSCCFSSSSSRAPAPPRQQQAPVAAVRSLDKDQLLQEKDKQIEELTRMLRQKQQLVETLRSQLEQGRGGGGGMEVDVKAQSLANGTAQAPRVKEEVKEEEEETDAMDEAQSQRTTQTQPCSQQTLLRLQQIQRLQAQQQHQKAGLPQQLQHNTGLLQQQNLQQQNAGLQQQQQKTGLPQQQNLQQQNAGLQQQQQQKAGLPQQLQHNTGLLQQQNAGLQQQKAGLPQQQNLQQQNAGLQQQKAGLPQQQQLVIQQSQQKQLQAQQQRSQHGKQQQLQTQSQQVSPVYVNQQSGTEVTAPSFPLDLLKGHGTHTLVTDSNGNHYLIALTTSSAEGQHGSSPRSKGNAHITLQRLQSTPCKLPQPVPASPDSQSKQQQQTAPIAMAQKAGLHLETNGFPESSLPVSAPPNLQPFFLNEESSSSMSQTTSPPPVKGEACPSFDRHTLFTPPSPKPNAHSSTQRSKENGLCSQHIDDLFDILIKSGEISAGFRAHPDPSLSHLHSGAPSPPASPLLLSPPSPPPAAAPQQPSPCPGAGRLEDFLESSTGAPLLGGADPDGPLTLMGDLHSQMLSTAGLLDHAPVPMDTGELSFSLHPAGLDFGDPALDGMDWLDISMGGGGAGGGAVLAPLGSHAPPSVFSADFLDGADLQLHWDACL